MEVKKIGFEENKKITYTSFTLLVLALVVFAVSEGGVFNRKVGVEAGVSNFSGRSRVFCWDYFGRSKATFNDVLVAPPYLDTDDQSFLDFYTNNPNMVYFDVEGDGDIKKHPALVFRLGQDFDRDAFREVEKTLVSGVTASGITYNKSDPAPTYLAYYAYAILKNEAKVDELVIKMKDETNTEVKKRQGEAVKKLNSLLDLLYREKTRLKQFTDSKAKYPRQVCQALSVKLKDLPSDEEAQKQVEKAAVAGQGSGGSTNTNPTSGSGSGTSTGGQADPSNPYSTFYGGGTSGSGGAGGTAAGGGSGGSTTGGGSAGGTTSPGGSSGTTGGGYMPPSSGGSTGGGGTYIPPGGGGGGYIYTR